MEAAPVTSPTDPELAALPEPRRPYRRLTLAVMLVTTVAALWTATALLPSARYALSTAEPAELGGAPPDEALNNRWVHLRGVVTASGIEYRRPLDPDYFRLAHLEGAHDLWVEVRIPADVDKAHYVPPTSFVGRLVRATNAGLRHGEIGAAVERVTGEPLPADTWLLIDGEAPRSTRWVLGVVALLVAFAAFNVWGVVHLSRPVGDA